MKNSFKAGLLVGIVSSFLAVLIVFSAFTVHARRTRWNGIDPNTKIMEIYSLLNRHSIVPFNKDEMLENMYRGFLDGVGCPYTQYFCADALAAFYARTEGAFVGIGVTVFVEEGGAYLTIGSTFRGAPAAEAGVLPGDQILGVDGKDVAGFPREQVIALITGYEGTDVTLTIFRPYENERIDLTMTRARVEIPTVSHEMLHTETGAVGFIRIESFDRVTTGQFEDALSELYADGMNGLILDLRNNPGGLLCAVNEITDMLIPYGIILSTVNAAGHQEDIRTETAEYLGLPLIVLVNERSASASEVLSGAVRDSGAGTLIGTQTFGKGVVQNLLHLSDGTAIKLTVQKYYTPAGESIHGIGITPHIEIEMPEDLSRRIGNLEPDEDVQLQAALEVMDEKLSE